MKKNQQKEIRIICEFDKFNIYDLFNTIDNYIYQAKQEERDRILKNIGQLRQWLNERTEDRLITNEDIETFLNK